MKERKQEFAKLAIKNVKLPERFWSVESHTGHCIENLQKMLKSKGHVKK